MSHFRTSSLRHTFRVPVKPPPWWEGHVIHYKEYPHGIPGPGYCALNLSSRDAEFQRRPPYEIGQRIRCSIGGTWFTGAVSEIDIHRPGWTGTHAVPNDFDPEEDPGDWLITVSFPGLPKPGSDAD